MDNHCTDAQLLEFWTLLDQTAFIISKAREIELNKHGISIVQNKILISLWILDHDPTLGELSSWLFREQSSTSCITERMVKRGLVRKYQDPVNKRLTRIAITEKGKQAYLNTISRELLLKIFSEISREECERVKDCLKVILNRAMEEADIRYSPLYAQVMVSCILSLDDLNGSSKEGLPNIQIHGINQNRFLMDIIYSYCPPEQLFVWVYLDQATYAISKARDREIRKYGISLIQSKVLSALKMFDHNPTLGELSLWLFREHNSTSDITNRMAKKALLRKYQDSAKKHLTRIAISKKGEQAYINAFKNSSIINILSFLTPQECEQVKFLLQRLFNKAVLISSLIPPTNSKKPIPPNNEV